MSRSPMVTLTISIPIYGSQVLCIYVLRRSLGELYGHFMAKCLHKELNFTANILIIS